MWRPDMEHAPFLPCPRHVRIHRLEEERFGSAVSGRFALSSAIPCEIHIRADYDPPAVLIELPTSEDADRTLRLAEAFHERVADEMRSMLSLRERARQVFLDR